MDLQDTQHTAKDGSAIRAASSLLLLTATVLLVGSLITEHSATTSPNSGRLATVKTI
jgi:hypothetical protein